MVTRLRLAVFAVILLLVVFLAIGLVNAQPVASANERALSNQLVQQLGVIVQCQSEKLSIEDKIKQLEAELAKLKPAKVEPKK